MPELYLTERQRLLFSDEADVTFYGGGQVDLVVRHTPVCLT